MSIDTEEEIFVEPPELAVSLAEVAAHRRRGLFFVGLATAGVGFTLAIQLGLNANFLADDIGVSGFRMGLLESTREMCGIVAFIILALLAGLAEPIVAALMLMVLAVGLGSYCWVHNYWLILFTGMIWSQGLHVWMPLPNSMTLALAESGRAGRRIGQINAAWSAGFGIGLAVAYVLSRQGMAMRPMYLIAAAASILAAGSCLAIPRQIKTPGPRFVFRRRYRLYYALCFLDGWRKQIFLCFAGFLLVKIYHTDLKTILQLWIVVQVITYIASPLVGRLIDRIGERPVLTFYFGCLMVFFVGYATIKNRYMLYGLFIVDNAFFVFHMALTTYVNKIAPKSEHTPTLSMGVAMNHIAAVMMPLVGGLLWEMFDYKWTFLIGAAGAALSVPVALRLPAHVRSKNT